MDCLPRGSDERNKLNAKIIRCSTVTYPAYEKTKLPFKNPDWTFPYLNNPTSNGHNSLIRTRNCANLAALERLFQDISYVIWKHTYIILI
ncbi:hypothetical protein H5410_060356 [Solanum commersonii]|uniref:Uncharacterized protein n=1 Tax=Solanum commersonii TaxID=4109 RepID=A0A9J5W6B1_SOLCO|nr:hypothetical protein H5410_060356 [Solanum commersonii]